jgi:hypothetical protein
MIAAGIFVLSGLAVAILSFLIAAVVAGFTPLIPSTATSPT